MRNEVGYNVMRLQSDHIILLEHILSLNGATCRDLVEKTDLLESDIRRRLSQLVKWRFVRNDTVVSSKLFPRYKVIFFQITDSGKNALDYCAKRDGLK